MVCVVITTDAVQANNTANFIIWEISRPVTLTIDGARVKNMHSVHVACNIIISRV